MTGNEIRIETKVQNVQGTYKGSAAAYSGDTLLHEDSIALASATSRTRFARAVAEKLGSPDCVDEIDRRLLEKLDELRRADQIAPDDLDLTRIARPELFITPEVVGLTIPTIGIVGSTPTGRWRLYLRWSDGRRDVREYSSRIDLPDGRRIWLHPEPTPPPINLVSPWSAQSRKSWQNGAPAPDPAEVFASLCRVELFYLDLPGSEEQAAAIAATIALWIILTHTYQAWDAVPYLNVGGPAGSGKSRLFEVLARLVARPVSSSTMSPSSLFRRLNDRGGTLLLDEAERLKESSPEVSELRSILLAGYKRGGRAIRNEPLGDGRFEQVEFDVYGPKALACITGLPPALSSRCIPITMFRSAPGSEKPKHRIDDDPSRWSKLRDDLHVLALEYGAEILDVARRDDVCPAMTGRNYELWQPLLALASWIEDRGATGLLRLVQENAFRLIDSSREDQTPDADEVLLRLLKDHVEDLGTPTPSQLLEKARSLDEETFRRWSSRGVSNALRKYGIVTRASHGVRAYRDVTVDDLARIQVTYGIPLGID
jgi:hypothetical protein